MKNWTPIKGYEGMYSVSDTGEILSLKASKPLVMQQIINNKGYKVINLFHKKMKQFRVARLVALHFVDNPENKPQVNHIDGDKLNNEYYNLEWCTTSENTQHAYDMGLKVQAKGMKTTKLNPDKVREIRHMYGLGNISLLKIGNIYDVSEATIRNIIIGKSWKFVN